MKKSYAPTVLAVILILLLAFSGCSSTEGGSASPTASGQATNAPAADTPRTNLNIRLYADPTSMDPQMITSSYDAIMAIQVYDCLFEAPDGNFENLQPSLCETYEVNDTATEYVFHIRKNVPFQNGDIMTAEDVAFTLNRLVTSPVTSVTYGGIAGAEVIDDATVKVTCNYPVFRLPSMLAMYPAGIVNKSLVEKYGDNAIEAIIGTGAYRFVEWVPGSKVVMKAFNEGWRGAPKIQDVNFVIILDNNAARMAFQNEELDDFYPTTRADVELLKDDARFVSQPYTVAVEDHLVYNTVRPWCDNIKFRQAVAHAIDREALTDICSDGIWPVAESIISPGNIAYRDGLKFPYEYNPEKAKQLLSECGYDGTEIGLLYTSSYPVSNTWGTTVEGYLRAVGINVKMEGADYANVVERVVGRDYDMCLFEYSVSYNDPLSSYYALYRSDGFYNVWQVSSEEMDNLIISMYGMNDAQLSEAMQGIDAWAQEQCIYVPCYQQGGYWFRPAKLAVNTTPEPMFGHVRLCYANWGS